MKYFARLLIFLIAGIGAIGTSYAKDGEYKGITHPVYASVKESMKLKNLAEHVFLDLTLARIALFENYEDGALQILNEAKKNINKVTNLTDNHVMKIYIPAIKVVGSRGVMGTDIFYFPVRADGSYVAAEDELEQLDLDTTLNIEPPTLHEITFNEETFKNEIQKFENELQNDQNKQALRTLTALSQIMFEE